MPRTIVKHDQSHTPTYKIWTGMRGRCATKRGAKHDRYGGRGIHVCERWDVFEHFMADMGPRPSSLHSIDRIDNDGNYEPTNCRWATSDEQNGNRRNTLLVTIDGVTKPAFFWAKEYGIHRATFQGRIYRGVIGRALLRPPAQPTNNLPTGRTRKTSNRSCCPAGHAYNEANTYRYERGNKIEMACRVCNRAAVARSKERRKLVGAP